MSMYDGYFPWSKIKLVDSVLTDFYKGLEISPDNLYKIWATLNYYESHSRASHHWSKQFKIFIWCLRDFFDYQDTVSANSLNRARWNAFPPGYGPIQSGYIPEYYR